MKITVVMKCMYDYKDKDRVYGQMIVIPMDLVQMELILLINLTLVIMF